MRIRHTAVVVLTVLAASLLGLSVAVVAFGQSSADPTSDYTVPLGDYTQTTPAQPTTPTPTLPETGGGGNVPSGGKKTPHVTRRTTTPVTPPTPSKVTRRVNTLAFTGAEPLLVGLGGAALMLVGFALYRRRRAGRPAA